jgi:hypothetical protein
MTENQSRTSTARRFCFVAGMPAGEKASIRDEQGHVLLTYRGFASIVGMVGAMMACIVTVAGLAGFVFLITEGNFLAAAITMILTLGFAALIAMLVPTISVTLFEDDKPSVMIEQYSRIAIPVATYVVRTGDGQLLAVLRKSVFSRLGRNRWRILDAENRTIGEAVEESLGRALIRKIAGKFNPSLESNVHIRARGRNAGSIIRRPNGSSGAGYLDVPPDAPMDRRVAIAIATLVFGSEP